MVLISHPPMPAAQALVGLMKQRQLLVDVFATVLVLLIVAGCAAIMAATAF